MKKLFFIIILSLFSLSIFSQEVIIYSGTNYDKTKIQKYQKSQNLKTDDTLDLPFFDDFSTSFPEIEPSLWLDNNVKVSQTASYKPPSLGTATFDAIDSIGSYYTSSYNSTHIADYLTSKPIDLNYPGNNTIFFSFYYQAQGLTDFPQIRDSLVLQFYSPETEVWETVWSAEGLEEHQDKPDFNFVMLQITHNKFQKKGFQFRFYNKASLGQNNNPSIVGNCDHWYVDYIYLDIDRDENDIVFHDVAIQHPIDFLIDDYETIAYEHYKNSPAKYDFNINYKVKYRNNDNKTRSFDSLNIIFKEKNNYVENHKQELGSYTFQENKSFTSEAENIEFSFPILNKQRLDFEMKTYCVTDDYDSTYNNSVIQSKILSGNYAYDDGTAEAGYGLYGEGTLHSLVAYKYNTYMEDTLKGVQIFFNKTFKDAQPTYFYLMVWDEDETTGLPGELIYEKDGMEIDRDMLNKFQTYYIDSSFTVAGTFYVGWKKTDNRLMNVGIDLNRTENNHKYYNINGVWKQSSYGGELLMQPFFATPNIINVKEIDNTFNITLFPNPTSNILNYNIVEQNTIEKYNICIYDMYGKLNFIKQSTNQGSIDVSNYSKGIYFMRISNSKGIIQNKKFIVQ